MNNKLGPDHYRYFATLGPSGVKIEAETFIVIGETPKCWYIISEHYVEYANSKNAWRQMIAKKHTKRVLKQQDHGRRYAYTDRKLAMFSFEQRKFHHLKRLQHQLATAQLSYKMAKKLVKAGEAPGLEIDCGHNTYTSRLRWAEY